MSGPFAPKGPRDAWFRIGSLFGSVLLLLVFSLMLLGGGGPMTFAILVAGGVLVVLFNLWMLRRSRTSQLTWMPGSETTVLRDAFEFLGIAPGLWVNAWKTLAGAAVALALVAVVVG